MLWNPDEEIIEILSQCFNLKLKIDSRSVEIIQQYLPHTTSAILVKRNFHSLRFSRMNDVESGVHYNCIALRLIVKWNIWIHPYSQRRWCWRRRSEHNVQCTCSNEGKVRVHYARMKCERFVVVYSVAVTAAHQRDSHASTSNIRTSHNPNIFWRLLLIYLHQFSTRNGFNRNDAHTQYESWMCGDQNTIKIKWITNLYTKFFTLFVSMFEFEFHRDLCVQWEFRFT